MVTWVSNTHLAVRWISRSQNASVLTVCDVTVGVCLQVGVTILTSERRDRLSPLKRRLTLFCTQRHAESSDTWLSGQVNLCRTLTSDPA